MAKANGRGDVSTVVKAQEDFPGRLPVGMRLLVAFFLFGAAACATTVAALLFAGSILDYVCRINPHAHAGFQNLGTAWSVAIMGAVGTACGSAAYGLARKRGWGRRLAIVILCVNLIGDSINALARQDARTLIGLPIGAALIFYLMHIENRRQRRGEL